MRAERVWLSLILVAMGASWGLTIPLTKIKVGGGYLPFGLIFWDLVVSVILLGAVILWRGHRLVLGRAALVMCLTVALIGTVLPNTASYAAAVHLPGGVMAIVLSLVPIFAFPVALLLATDRFSWVRFGGLLAGLAGVLLLVGPEASLPTRAMVVFIPLAMVAPALYGIEGNVVARFGMGGLNPVELLFGASVLGVLLVGPLALATGQWIDPRPPWGAPDAALLATAVIHAAVYTSYVWMVGRAGAVFAAQVSYLVTGFGVFWSMLLLSERYSGWIWAAMALMMVGLFLVQPRPKAALVAAAPVPHDVR